MKLLWLVYWTMLVFTSATDGDTQELEVFARAGYTVTHTDGKVDSVTAELQAGQDAALAAFLFCDEQQRTGMGFGEISTLLDVARQLTSSLERSGSVEAAKAAVNASVFLKTAGAYKKRAKAASSDDRYDDAAVDLMRAALRPGIDPQALEAVEKDLGIALRDLKEQREVEAKEEAERAAQIAREDAEREATEATARFKAEDEADWAAWESQEALVMASLADDLPDANQQDPATAQLPSIQLTLTTTPPGGEPTQKAVRAVLRENEDPEAAAARFCIAHGMKGSADSLFDITQRLASSAGGVPNASSENPAEALASAENKAKALLDSGDCAGAAAGFARQARLAGALDIDQALRDAAVAQAREGASEALTRAVSLNEATALFLAHDYEKAASALEPLVRVAGASSASSRLYLMRARCFAQLGRWPEAARTAGTWLTWAASSSAVSGRWQRGTPRMLLATIGAAAALEAGDTEKAKKYFQLVLRADPDQVEVAAQYAALKKLLKLLKTSDELLAKGYNHRALATLDEALASMRGLQMSSGTFRSGILLKLCASNSQIKRHEEALQFCDQALELRQPPGATATATGAASSAASFVDPASVREALVFRAEALERDQDHDEAVRDWAKALELAEAHGADQDAVMNLRRRLQAANQAQRQWRERRDHLATLELPANLDQLSPEKQCIWVKKQHRKLARKWHPDKYRGNPERGSRKMREVSESKKVLSDRFKCK